MSGDPGGEEEAAAGRRWWREPEIAILIALVVAAYLVRIGDVSMRGEEPRRAQVAFQLQARGDWVVPWDQDTPFLSRPPFQNWLIAGSTMVCGSRAPWAVRLPSVLAMGLTVLLIYGYSRTRLSRVGALAAAAGFATFGELFTTGSQAETEMVFIALVSGSLLLWHWGQLRCWPATWTWMASYACVGLGVLCKGPQAPVYFFTAVTTYLLLTGQWRRLFTSAHVLGAAVGVGIVLCWLIPCIVRTSWPTAKAIVMNDATARMWYWPTRDLVWHLLRFPLETLGCTLPWSLLLLAYTSRAFRRSLAEARPLAFFQVLCVVPGFVSCWIPPEGQTRYFAPLYPCLAVLIGLVVDRLARADVPARLRRGWHQYVLLCAGTMVLAALAVLLGACLWANHATLWPWAEKWTVACGYAVAVAALVVLTLRGRHAGDPARVRMTALAIASFMVLTFTGVVTNIRARRSEDQPAAVARLKEQLPPGHRMVSLGHIDDLFGYYYGLPIQPLHGFVDPQGLTTTSGVYFCFTFVGNARPQLPFAWEEVSAISMDRNHQPIPEEVVVIGRRLQTAASGTVTVPARP